ncbi:hypothetical protein ACRPK2_04040 [Lactococcus garvieae]|uniref:hypothetical protein n=1 Tax=Lactococcus garvieae TaxID=1363 RepID=UPI003D780732
MFTKIKKSSLGPTREQCQTQNISIASSERIYRKVDLVLLILTEFDNYILSNLNSKSKVLSKKELHRPMKL